MKQELVRDLAAALGWAVFVGIGIALGLSIGALTSDVGADSEMIVLAALIAGAGTLVVRLGMLVVRRIFSATREASGDVARPPDEERRAPKARSGARSRPLTARPGPARKGSRSSGARRSASGRSGSRTSTPRRRRK